MRIAGASLRARLSTLLLAAIVLAACEPAPVTPDPGPVARPAVPAKPAPVWRTDLQAALATAKRQRKPLLVVSVIGDLTTRC